MQHESRQEVNERMQDRFFRHCDKPQACIYISKVAFARFYVSQSSHCERKGDVPSGGGQHRPDRQSFARAHLHFSDFCLFYPLCVPLFHITQETFSWELKWLPLRKCDVAPDWPKIELGEAAIRSLLYYHKVVSDSNVFEEPMQPCWDLRRQLYELPLATVHLQSTLRVTVA